MSESFTFVDWTMCAVAILAVACAIYTHSEGNRFTATRFVYHDIRREMGNHPRRVVLWRAFNIAMGWRKRPGSKRARVTSIDRFAPKPLD